MNIIIPEELQKYETKILEKKNMLLDIAPFQITVIAKAETEHHEKYLCAVKNSSNFSLRLNRDKFNHKEEIYSITPEIITVKKDQIFVFIINSYKDQKREELNIGLDYNKFIRETLNNAEHTLADLEVKLNIVETPESVVNEVDFSKTMQFEVNELLKNNNVEEEIKNILKDSPKAEILKSAADYNKDFETITTNNRSYIKFVIEHIEMLDDKYEFVINLFNDAIAKNIKISKISLNVYEKDQLVKKLGINKEIFMTAGTAKKLTFRLPKKQLLVNLQKVKFKATIY